MLWQELRYALRALTSRIGFTAAVVLTLTLGIGANSAIFSVLNGLLLSPLPYADGERLSDLNAALTDSSIDAVWCLRGGNGMNRIVDRVDFAGFAAHPKPVIGYSDITVLLMALTTQTGVVTFHGPMARFAMPAFSKLHFDRALVANTAAGKLGRVAVNPNVLVPERGRIVTVVGGKAAGRLVGGNLTLLQALVGTSYFPDLTGASLFLEDVTAWLELHEIRFTPNVKFTGRTGYDHTFDFVVPASRRAPERLIRAVNRPSRDLAEALAFSWVDTKEVRPAASRFYAFLNDEGRAPSATIVDALRNYEIAPVLWTHRDEVRQELVA